MSKLLFECLNLVLLGDNIFLRLVNGAVHVLHLIPHLLHLSPNLASTLLRGSLLIFKRSQLIVASINLFRQIILGLLQLVNLVGELFNNITTRIKGSEHLILIS